MALLIHGLVRPHGQVSIRRLIQKSLSEIGVFSGMAQTAKINRWLSLHILFHFKKHTKTTYYWLHLLPPLSENQTAEQKK
jgi:hypothetical protein